MWKGYVIANQGQASVKTGYFPANCVLLLETKGCKNMSGYYANGSADPRGPIAVVPSQNVPDLIAKQHHHCAHNHADADRDSGISPQQNYPSQPQSSPQGFVKQHSPHSTNERTAEWLGRYVSIEHSDGQSNSPASSSRGSPSSSNRNSITSTNSGGYVSNHYVNSYHPGHHHPHHHYSQQQQQQQQHGGSNGSVTSSSAVAPPSNVTHHHRLSGQSYESSGVSSSRQSYHSGSSSSLGSLDRLEESGYASTVNVHELFLQGLPDHEVLRTWLTDLHYEEYYKLFIHAGYDMPTISRMTPEDLTAIGVTKPAHRKRLKSEISKLHIHDGIPEYKPGTLREWLRLLCLDEYTHTLTSQGYDDVEMLTDITWEDLEDIGVKRLGHQKKIMLAIDRLRRIQNGQYKPPSDNYRGSQELLEPPSAYPNFRYMDGNNRGTSPCPNSPKAPPGGGGGDYVIHKPPRSPSMDNLINRGLDGSKIYASREDVYASKAAANAMRSSSSSSSSQASHYQVPSNRISAEMIAAANMGYSPQHAPQDIIAIQVHRQANTTPTPETEQNGGGGDGGSSGGGHLSSASSATHSSFHSPNRSRHSSGPGSGSEFSVYDRGVIEDFESSNSTGTLTRPSAKISPQIKPKPIATIVAKSPRNSSSVSSSSDMSKSSDSNYSRFNGHAVNLAKNYSSGSLPRNASMRGNSHNMAKNSSGTSGTGGTGSGTSGTGGTGTGGIREHIYDLPANSYPQHRIMIDSNAHHSPVIRPSMGSAPSSPHHSATFFGGGVGGSKKAPPPPPKRTNSIKHGGGNGGSHLPSKPVHPALRKASADTFDTQSVGSAHSDDEHAPPPLAMPLLSNSYGLSERFGRNSNNNGSNKAPDRLSPGESPSAYHGSPSKRGVNSNNSAAPSSGGNRQYGGYGSDMPSPLTDAIHQLQFNATGLVQNNSASSHATPSGTQRQQQDSQCTNLSNGAMDNRPALPEKPKHPRVGEWQEREFDSSGSGSDSDSSRHSTLKRPTTSSGTVDSNTLPFANENVGTIKQRNAVAKPSIVSISGYEGEDGDVERNVELNSSVFEDSSNNTDTMKRSKHYSAGSGAGSRAAAVPATATSSQSYSDNNPADGARVAPASSTGQGQAAQGQAAAQANGAKTGDVLNDIGNMLQDLTDELDAMLEFELP